MALRRLPVLVLTGLLAGCAGGEPPPAAPGATPSPTVIASQSRPTTGIPMTTPDASPPPPSTARPVPRRISPEDDGAAFTMTVGQTTTLQVPLPGRGDPVVTGTSVLVIAVVNVAPAAASEWEVRAVEPGTSVVRGTNPDFTITFVVR